MVRVFHGSDPRLHDSSVHARRLFFRNESKVSLLVFYHQLHVVIIHFNFFEFIWAGFVCFLCVRVGPTCDWIRGAQFDSTFGSRFILQVWSPI